MIDACCGFAQPALDLAVSETAAMARSAGIAVAAIRGSYNALALGQPARELAEAGLIALVLGNAPASVAIPGSARPAFGTNPLAFSAPLQGRPPLVIDQSASVVTKTVVMRRAADGRALEPGWGQDATGAPTTDAVAALAGALLPAGGRKGTNIALIVEVLAAALPGATLSALATPFSATDRAHPAVGQTVIAIDPEGLGAAAVPIALATLAGILTADGARLPGQRRAERRARSAANGLELAPAMRKLLGLPE